VTPITGRDQGTNNGATGGSSSYSDNNSTSSSEAITNKSSVSSVNNPSQVSDPSQQMNLGTGEEHKTGQTDNTSFTYAFCYNDMGLLIVGFFGAKGR
jgi:hypothetical protein